MRKFKLLLAAAVAAMAWSGWSAARAQQSDEALKATFERVAKIAQEAVDTARFKKNPPYHIGVSAGYYAQEHEGIRPGVTVLDHMREGSAAPHS